MKLTTVDKRQKHLRKLNLKQNNDNTTKYDKL